MTRCKNCLRILCSEREMRRHIDEGKCYEETTARCPWCGGHDEPKHECRPDRFLLIELT